MKKASLLALSFLGTSVLWAQHPVQPKVSKQVITTQTTRNTNSGVVSVKPEDIVEELCPSALLRGDREFDGNGPRIKCEVKISLNRDSTQVWADIYFWAQETKSDWSTTERTWRKKIYDAPYGKKIAKINSDRASRTQFISPKAGMQIFVPGQDVSQALYNFLDFTDVNAAVLQAFGFTQNDKAGLSSIIKATIDRGNTIVRVPPVEGTLVKFFHIVGDTGAQDISEDDNCNDDTRIVKIEFFPIRLELQSRTAR
ncbi:MAG: hypothetical protein K2X48_02690 [Chitinophagaceae bacterium]|nr:hypothetical protein [Chitinophagaceae bacterium]